MLAVTTLAINSVNAQLNSSPELNAARPVIETLARAKGHRPFCKEEVWQLMPPINNKSTKSDSLREVLDYCCQTQLLTYNILDSVIRIFTTSRGEAVLKGQYALFYLFDPEGEPLTEVTYSINGAGKKNLSGIEKGMLLIRGLKEGDSILFAPSFKTAEERFRFSGAPVQLILFHPNVSELASIEVSKTPNGYQDIEQDRLTGTNKNVQKEQFARSVETDIIGRLRYSAPNYVPPLSHIPGGYPKTGTTRGINSIEGNMGMLLVRDNMPVRNPETINPNDIASITIADDAATMALYGSRAANGLVIMTSKRSLSNKLQVGIISNLTISPAPTSFPSIGIDSKDYGDLQKKLFDTGAYKEMISKNKPLPPLIAAFERHRLGVLSKEGLDSVLKNAQQQDIKKDLSKYLYQPGYTKQLFLNLAQSFKYFQFYASLGKDHATQNTQGSYHDRITTYISANWNRVKNLALSVDVSYAGITGRKNPYQLSIVMPNLRLADEKGNPLPLPSSIQNSPEDTMANGQKLDPYEWPLQEWRLVNDKYKQNYRSINPRAAWRPWPWLEFNLLYAHGINNYKETNIHDKESFMVRNELSQHAAINNGVLTFTIPQGDIYDAYETKMHFNDTRFQVNIRPKSQKNKLIAIAGIESQSTKTNISSNRIYGYGTLQEKPADQNTKVDSVDYYTGIYLNAIYSIREKIILSGSLRKDQMNRYGPQSLLKGPPFYSLGTAIHINKLEPYFSHWPSITLRATIGESGNDNKTLLVNTTIRNADPINFHDPVSDIENFANTSLGPERLRLFNTGIELYTLDNLFHFGFDYFWKSSNSLLGWKQLNPNSGTSYIKSNSNSLKGHGFDFYMKADYGQPNIILSSFFWLSHTINTITSPQVSLDKVYKYNDLEYYRPQQSYPVNAFYAFRFLGLDSIGDPIGVLHGFSSKEYDKIINNKDPSTIKYIGSATPTWYGSVTQTMLIRQFFELSFQVSYNLGYYYKRQSLNSGDLIAGTGVHSDYYISWKKPGDERLTNVPSVFPSNNMARDIFIENSEENIQPADNIRLEFFRIGLLFDKKRVAMLKKGTFSCYMTLQSLKPLWTKNSYREDPEFAQATFTPGARISISTQLNF